MIHLNLRHWNNSWFLIFPSLLSLFNAKMVFREHPEWKTTPISNNLQKNVNLTKVFKGHHGREILLSELLCKNCRMWELLFGSFWLENYKVSMLFLKVFIFFKLDIGSNTLFKYHCLEVHFLWKKKKTLKCSLVLSLA